MSVVLGRTCKLYYKVDTTWTEITCARDVTISLEKTEVDATTRGTGGWAQTETVMRDLSIEFELLWDGSTAAKAIRAAAVSDDTIELAAMDGPIETAGSEGPQCQCKISRFERSEPKDGLVTFKVTAKPAFAANPPSWAVVTGS